AMMRELVAGSAERGHRSVGVSQLGLLHQQDVGARSFEPPGHLVESSLERIHVPGRDAHRAPRLPSDGFSPYLDAMPDDDRPTEATADGWNHNSHYHALLLAAVPRSCSRALDVGCGLGSFARRLARVADQVDAIDREPAVLERAREL